MEPKVLPAEPKRLLLEPPLEPPLPKVNDMVMCYRDQSEPASLGLGLGEKETRGNGAVDQHREQESPAKEVTGPRKAVRFYRLRAGKILETQRVSGEVGFGVGRATITRQEFEAGELRASGCLITQAAK